MKGERRLRVEAVLRSWLAPLRGRLLEAFGEFLDGGALRSGEEQTFEVAFVADLGHGFQKSGRDAFVPDFEKFDNGFLAAFLAAFLPTFLAAF